jgi:hypothetical protein
MRPERRNVQNDKRFKSGNAMSRAPIMSGMQKLPNAPMRIGVMAKKIMMRPCVVNIPPYVAGVMAPPVSGKSAWPSTGTGWPGNAHCQRMSIASVPPNARKKSPAKRNCLAMTL